MLHLPRQDYAVHHGAFPILLEHRRLVEPGAVAIAGKPGERCPIDVPFVEEIALHYDTRATGRLWPRASFARILQSTREKV